MACSIFPASLWRERSLVGACESASLTPGSNPGPLHWELRVLATGPQGSPDSQALSTLHMEGRLLALGGMTWRNLLFVSRGPLGHPWDNADQAKALIPADPRWWEIAIRAEEKGGQDSLFFFPDSKPASHPHCLEMVLPRVNRQQSPSSFDLAS